MVVNKYLASATPLVINVTNFAGNGTAQVWQLNSSNVIAQMSGVPYQGVLNRRPRAKRDSVCSPCERDA